MNLQVMNLKMTLLESVHRNDELSELLVQKDQQIEQQDKTSRAQARVIKVTNSFTYFKLARYLDDMVNNMATVMKCNQLTED